MVNSEPVPPVLKASLNKQRLYLLLIVAVCGYGVMAYFFLDKVQMILMGVAVTIGVGYGLKTAFSNNTRVVIDKSGVLDTRLGIGTISWSDITHVYVTTYNNVDIVCMDVADPQKYLRKHSFASKAALKFHATANKVSPFNINPGVLDVSASEVYDAIMAGREYYGESQYHLQ